MATGHVPYDTKDQHSSKEVLAFVKFIDLHVAKDLEIHVVPKNLSATRPIRTRRGSLIPSEVARVLHPHQFVVAQSRGEQVQLTH